MSHSAVSPVPVLGAPKCPAETTPKFKYIYTTEKCQFNTGNKMKSQSWCCIVHWEMPGCSTGGTSSVLVAGSLQPGPGWTQFA